jgi:hypothetical protein
VTAPSIRNFLFAALCALICAAAVIGCASSNSSSTGLAFLPPAPERTGAQLWGDNCKRCHWTRPPGEFGPGQWAAITAHMRLRADLTGQEQQKITAFLQGEE